MQHYAKGVAYATVRDFAAADRQRELFHTQLERIPAGRRFLSNPAHASLAVGAALLDGELAYHKGRHEQAYGYLRRAVELDDNLSYTEPWAWMHPPRHALAALLLDQGHISEAEQVYRDDLGLSDAVQRCTRHPDNVWALHGLAECLARGAARRRSCPEYKTGSAQPVRRPMYPSVRPACAGQTRSRPQGAVIERKYGPRCIVRASRSPGSCCPSSVRHTIRAGTIRDAPVHPGTGTSVLAG